MYLPLPVEDSHGLHVACGYCGKTDPFENLFYRKHPVIHTLYTHLLFFNVRVWWEVGPTH